MDVERSCGLYYRCGMCYDLLFVLVCKRGLDVFDWFWLGIIYIFFWKLDNCVIGWRLLGCMVINVYIVVWVISGGVDL